jgi:ABC-type nitrate/sulfonate/bicarbonate transport system ATPase subunit
MSAIEIRGVSKLFRSNRKLGMLALENINLSIQSGEFIAVINPSGCGKGTLLHPVAINPLQSTV